MQCFFFGRRQCGSQASVRLHGYHPSEHSTALCKSATGLYSWCRVSALDAVPGSLVLETQHSHRLETFLGRQVLRGHRSPPQEGSKTRHKRLEGITTSTRCKQSVGRTVSNHNLFHESVMGFPPVFEHGAVAGSLPCSYRSGFFLSMCFAFHSRRQTMTKINFEKCLRKPIQRILGNATSHKKQHEPTFPNEQATKMRPGSKKIIGTSFKDSG